MDILNALGLGQSQTAQASQQLGVAPDQMQSALEAAVPLMISQMGANAQDPAHAERLSQAMDQHDGSALDQFGQGSMPNLDDGQRIAGHVFGDQQGAAVNAVSQRAGISPQVATQVISMAAPLVMAYLSRNRNAGGAGGAVGNLGGLGSILGSVLGGGAAGGLGGMLGGMLGGGQQQQPQQGGMGDLGGMLGSLLGGGQQQPQAQQPQQQGGMGDLSGMLGGLMGGQGGQGGLGGLLGSVLGGGGQQGGQQPQQGQQAGNPLEDLIGMFGGTRR
ncbi:DUF937 domain-containing protein [Deinococcus sp.]|uniref:DUF937 domain-containing protein n=1 Tax=Deinococcus sp. TaxID=47478 RepID=UPI0025CC6627|nr:DUF937 domain-containing protein [Deinococcus sp.]